MHYSRPEVEDFGSVAGHIYDNPGAGDKMDTPVEPYHLDKFCEFSGGTDPDSSECV